MKRDVYKVFGECLVLTLAFAILLGFVVACSGSDYKDFSGGVSGDAGVVALKNKRIAGVAQKGPLEKGSNVVLRETSADGSLEPTGREYNTTITGDKGSFTIDDIDLESQYVLLSAEGYYTHEWNQSRSECQMHLDAVSDLGNRNTSNINLLTHFEYKRVLNLFKSGKSFAEAKKQAITEVFAAFGVDIEAPLAEDLNIFNTTEGDRTLYNISLFVDSRDLWNPWEGEDDPYAEWEHWTNRDSVDCSKLQKFIDGFADDFADDGMLSDTILQYLASDAYDYARTYSAAEFYSEKGMKAKEAAGNPGAYDHLTVMKKKYDFGKIFFLNYMGVEQCTENLWGEVRKFERPIALYDVDLEQTVIRDSGYLLCDGFSWEIKTKEQIDSLTMKIDHESGTMTDPRDGKSYKTVSFVFNGKKYEWMAEDLDYRNGPDPFGWSKFSGLYTWTAAMQIDDKYMNQEVDEDLIDSLHQGICPDGWHVSSVKDWADLIAYVGGADNLLDETWRTDRGAAFGKDLIGVFYNRFDFNLKPMDAKYLKLYYHTYAHESFFGDNTQEVWYALYDYYEETHEAWALELAEWYRYIDKDMVYIDISIGSAWPQYEPLAEARVRCVKN